MTADRPRPAGPQNPAEAAYKHHPAVAPPRAFGLLPAAGRSLRMGAPKLLLPWHSGGCLVDQVLRNWLSSRVARLIVVVHPADQELAARVEQAGAVVVVPQTPPVDMRASIELGLAWIAQHGAPTADDVWLVAPADMPLLPAAAIDRLLAAHRPEQPQILAAAHQGRRGHPVLFPWPLSAQVPHLPQQVGLKRLLELHPVRQIDCPEPGVLVDIDTPEQYRQAAGLEKSS